MQSRHFLKILSWHLDCLGVILLASGIICLTALNWLAWSSLTKFILAESALIIVFIHAMMTQSPTRRTLSLALFAVLVGCFWTLFGQTYQINSHLYHLPMIWCLSLLPFALLFNDRFLTAFTSLLAYLFIINYLPVYCHNATIVLVSTVLLSLLLNLVFIYFSTRSTLSFVHGMSDLYFVLMWGSFMGLLFDLSVLDQWVVSRIVAVIGTLFTLALYYYLREKAQAILSYLAGMITLFLLLLELFSSALGFFSLSVVGLVMIYPAYRGADALFNAARFGDHHANP
ncbi:Hypothetical protein F387_00912 [Wohlfahrtiimonas chitiniclastica SH04]|uniref:DUF2157 domain-containing protein n=1 Tax=Wohlfahrtiimonas chitiniclastica SH04 TaxID=1261130 RepID=L8Y263_9GAMM|nr:DUF2157 domain-containing protein [Wohlfahrtiimonas chitiniclastica]ELV09020.1 Hypothetical protein F387_00912 [Wohlfahrtiimonas chitiniclastica SH04]